MKPAKIWTEMGNVRNQEWGRGGKGWWRWPATRWRLTLTTRDSNREKASKWDSELFAWWTTFYSIWADDLLVLEDDLCSWRGDLPLELTNLPAGMTTFPSVWLMTSQLGWQLLSWAAELPAGPKTSQLGLWPQLCRRPLWWYYDNLLDYIDFPVGRMTS